MAYYNGNEVSFSVNLNIVNVDVVQKKGQSALAVMSQKAVTDTTNAINKRVINLEHRIDASLIYTDNGTAYKKDVPAGALPYAAITKIGGMTYKDASGNLQDAKTTAIKGVGANKFNPQWLLNTGYDVTITDNAFYRGQASWFYAAYGQSPAQLPITNFKANTAYTISFEGYSENLSVGTFGFQYFYTDGTSDYSPFITGTINQRYSVVTDSNKTIQKIIMTYSEGDYVCLRNICIIEGNVAEYVPYMEKALAIPAAVQAIEGYGQGVNENCYNFIEWKPREGKKKFNKCLDCVDMGTLDWQGFGGYYAHTGAVFKPSANVVSALPSPFEDIRVDIYGALLVTFEEGRFTSADDVKTALSGVMLVYERATPDVTDISDILPDDNILKVEGGGTITFENEGQNSVPSEIIYNLS